MGCDHHSCLMRGSDRMHALYLSRYLHFTDAPLSDYARAENHSAGPQITFIFYSAEICIRRLNLFSEKATQVCPPSRPSRGFATCAVGPSDRADVLPVPIAADGRGRGS